MKTPDTGAVGNWFVRELSLVGFPEGGSAIPQDTGIGASAANMNLGIPILFVALNRAAMGNTRPRFLAIDKPKMLRRRVTKAP